VKSDVVNAVAAAASTSRLGIALLLVSMLLYSIFQNARRGGPSF
jgi:hypothetical protein